MFRFLMCVLSAPIMIAVGVLAVDGRGRPHSPRGAVQVRLGASLVQRLDRLEAEARRRGRRDITRSSMIRVAIVEYLKPLIRLLDQSGHFDPDGDLSRWPAASEGGSGDAVRVRLDLDIVDALDRVESYARGSGHKYATRSWLIRDAVCEFLDGAESEGAINDRDESPAEVAT